MPLRTYQLTVDDFSGNRPSAFDEFMWNVNGIVREDARVLFTSLVDHNGFTTDVTLTEDGFIHSIVARG